MLLLHHIMIGIFMDFTPVLRETFSIQKTLMEFAIDRKTESKLLDFELLDHETFIKRVGEDEQKINDTTSITSQDLANETCIITQKYNIKIFAKKQNTSQKIKTKLSANKLKTKIIATIEKGSIFESGLDLTRALKDLIWYKKLQGGLFIDIFEPFLDKQLTKLVDLVPINKAITKDIKFTVALGLDATLPTDAKLEKIYELKKQDSQSIIEGVDKDELIFVYTKQKKGSNGRACNAKFITVRAPRTVEPTPIIDESIYTKELNDIIEYYANTDGYVEEINNKFRISHNLKIDSTDFKASGNIETGEDKDISVHIAHSQTHSEDAVGGGVHIDVKELNVDGSIGANVKISTKELNIDAQTHKRSTLEVENTANVKLHRGDLKAKDANVEMLESGKIVADNSIHIKQMLGGEAIAPIVRVDSVLSNCTIIASKSIEIKSIAGENINLIIDADKIQSYHSDLENLIANIKEFKTILREKKKKFEDDFKEHSSQIDRVKTFKLRILKAQKDGKKPMKQDMIRIKDYKRKAESLKTTQSELKEMGSQLDGMEIELSKMYEIDLHAKVTCLGTYNGGQNIIFVNPKNKEEVRHHPNGHIKEISLTLNQDGQRVIKLN